MKTNLKYVEFDETQYWNEDFLNRIGTKKVTAVYIFDANRIVHCCELTPSYELYLATTYTDNELSDDDQEEFDESWTGERSVANYYHCSPIDEIAKDYPIDDSFEWEFEDDEWGDPFWIKMQDAAYNFEQFFTNQH
jgi:hypothetical protein